MDEEKPKDFRFSEEYGRVITDLLLRSQSHVNSLQPFSDHGDIPIFCNILSALFINGIREYIEEIRKSNGHPPEHGLACYKRCIRDFVAVISDDMIMEVFKNPPESWLDKAVKV